MNTLPVPTDAQQRTSQEKKQARWVVVITHHEARVFRSEVSGTVAEVIRPRQTDDSIRHTHRFDGFSRGHEMPAAHSFFGPVADALKMAERILIFGNGTGTANEMNQFVAWVESHCPEVAKRIAGTVTIDGRHLSDDQLLAKARDFFKPYPELWPARK
ncbi:MAG: hypothetical protein PHQ04_08845 [Opitutaceae bacterium]|nr:hypothetical protein [Opitutaceae bacterium]